MKRGVFQIMNPEGELYTVDTTKPGTPFYGSAWQNILGSRERGEFIRGRAATRCFSKGDRFSGYVMDIEGVRAFLPASKAGWFREQENDACGKFLALKAETVYVNGDKAGTMIVNANAPINYILNRQRRGYAGIGCEIYALAVDHDERALVFPWLESSLIIVPLFEAQRAAQYFNISSRPDDLTGYYWRLGLAGWAAANCLTAVPLEVMI